MATTTTKPARDEKLLKADKGSFYLTLCDNEAVEDTNDILRLVDLLHERDQLTFFVKTQDENDCWMNEAIFHYWSKKRLSRKRRAQFLVEYSLCTAHALSLYVKAASFAVMLGRQESLTLMLKSKDKNFERIGNKI